MSAFSSYLEKDYANDPRYKFGARFDNDTRFHGNADGGLDLSYDGFHIASVAPGGDEVYLMRNQNFGHTSGTTRRWERLMSFFVSHSFDNRSTNLCTKTVKTAAGVAETTVYIDIYKSEAVSGQRRNAWVRTQPRLTCTFREKARLFFKDGVLCAERMDPELNVSKDNKKYRAFNAKLRNLKAVLTAQAKMGANEDLIKGSRYSYDTPCANLMKDYFKQDYVWGDTTQKELIKQVNEWVKNDPDPTKLRFIAALCYYRRDTNATAGSIEDAVRRIDNALRMVQIDFLRTECVTISEPSNSSETLNNEQRDQDSQLLPPPGLREVQVPSEAEVC